MTKSEKEFSETKRTILADTRVSFQVEGQSLLQAFEWKQQQRTRAGRTVDQSRHESVAEGRRQSRSVQGSLSKPDLLYS